MLKYAQTLDGRIATSGGDSKWISGTQERPSHALRAACDAVMVGAGTVVADDPLLTVRMVPGASPIRVVLDSTLRVPPDSQIFGPDAATIVLTSQRSDPDRREALRLRGVKVEVVGQAPDGIDLAGGLASCVPWESAAAGRGRVPRHHVGTRTSMVWTMVGIGVVLLVAILVFILQHGQRVRVRFLMVDGTLQLGVALLFAALLGALLMLVAGGGAGAAAACGRTAPSPHRPGTVRPTRRPTT